jgi:four helix bundle protein
MMQDFRQLHVWQKAHRLTLSVYRATRSFPKEELYGLSSQLRRAASGIGANIAEGCGRGTDADFGRFLSMAMGSTSEVENHLLLARDLELLASADHDALAEAAIEVKKMLATLILKLKAES